MTDQEDFDDTDKKITKDEYITFLEKKISILEKADFFIKTSYAELSGYYFICGESGTKDDNGLPERIFVCPSHGVDWMMTYQRTDKASGPEY